MTFRQASISVCFVLMAWNFKPIHPRLSFFTYAKAEVMKSGRLSLIAYSCHSVCVQDYGKINEPISLKLGVVTQPTKRKN